MREQDVAGARSCCKAAGLQGFVDFCCSQIYQADASDDFEMLVDFVIRKEKRAVKPPMSANRTEASG
jgi:hypothetical protein